MEKKSRHCPAQPIRFRLPVLRTKLTSQWNYHLRLKRRPILTRFTINKYHHHQQECWKMIAFLYTCVVVPIRSNHRDSNSGRRIGSRRTEPLSHTGARLSTLIMVYILKD